MTKEDFTKATGVECSDADYSNVVMPLYEACGKPELDESSAIVKILNLPRNVRDFIVGLANRLCYLHDEFVVWKESYCGEEQISTVFELLDVLPEESLGNERIMEKIRLLLAFLPADERVTRITCYKLRSEMPLTTDEVESVCAALGH